MQNILNLFSNFLINKPLVSIVDEDIITILNVMRKQRRNWKTVRRESRLGDRLFLSENNGRVDSFILGEPHVWTRWESKLIGLQTGDYVNLPIENKNTDLFNKRFRVCKIESGKTPSLNAAFAHQLGIRPAKINNLLSEIRVALQHEVAKLTQYYVRQQVFDQLLTHYPKEHIYYTESNDIEKLDTILRDVIDHVGLRVDIMRVEDTLNLTLENTNLVNRSKKQKKHMDYELLHQTESAVLEAQIIELIVENAQTIEYTESYNDFIKRSNENEGFLKHWPSTPIIKLSEATRCSYCAGSRCCNYITVHIAAPRTKADFEHLLWQVSHEKVKVYQDTDGWYLMFETTCAHLQKNGRCGIYTERPKICRDYSAAYCEFDGSAEAGFKLCFNDYDSLLAYCRKRFKQWDNRNL